MAAGNSSRKYLPPSFLKYDYVQWIKDVQAEIQNWSEVTDRTDITAYQNRIVSSFGIASWEREE